MLSEVKRKRSSFPRKSAVDVFSELKLVKQHFAVLTASAKEIFLLQNPFSYATEELSSNLQLKINLHVKRQISREKATRILKMPSK